MERRKKKKLIRKCLTSLKELMIQRIFSYYAKIAISRKAKLKKLQIGTQYIGNFEQ